MSKLPVDALTMLAGVPASAGPVRLVLTGAGGATLAVTPGEPSGAATTIVADVVDYCRLAAQRIGVDELACTVDGDRAVARSVLATAAMFAM